jgi:DNA-binding NarL/FixJ family response regulator/class 3 adenylate cyclase
LTVTRNLRVIMFTDLVRSTEVFSRLPASRADEVRREHFTILGDLVAAHGGELVKTLGDGVMAAFMLATDALDCAIAAQQRLSLKQGEVSLPGLRAGLSAGEVSQEEGDYHAHTVIEAARLCALAKPGQVLSARVISLLVGSGTEHVFNDLGTHELKGLSAPVDVDEVLWTLPDAAAPRVLLADDAVVVRHGIARILEDAGCHVVGQAADAEELLRLTDELIPDVVVTDIKMPPTFELEGLEAALEIRRRHPAIGVLVLSQHLETEYAGDLLADTTSGVGYLLKERITAIDMFTAAVRRVAGGGTAVDPDIVAALMRRESATNPIGSLTEREREILGMMAEGLSNIGIAERLVLSGRTVESHVASIFSKLDIPPERQDDRRVQAVMRYLESAG